MILGYYVQSYANPTPGTRVSMGIHSRTACTCSILPGRHLWKVRILRGYWEYEQNAQERESCCCITMRTRQPVIPLRGAPGRGLLAYRGN